MEHQNNITGSGDKSESPNEDRKVEGILACLSAITFTFPLLYCKKHAYSLTI